MKFTTPCFVRVEDADERQKLLQWCMYLGYLCPEIPKEERLGELVICDGKCVGVVHNPATFSIEATYYDCGTDIELFKALAAMNDENDREQWFTDGTEWWLSKVNNFDSCMTTAAECEADNVGYYTYCQEYGIHKATAEELINHFMD